MHAIVLYCSNIYVEWRNENTGGEFRKGTLTISSHLEPTFSVDIPRLFA